MSMNKISNKQGMFMGLPYDFRAPTKIRFLSRTWNPTAPLVNPKWWGWGYDFNFYAIIHPMKWRKAHRKS
jgi:hypothetical protein